MISFEASCNRMVTMEEKNQKNKGYYFAKVPGIQELYARFRSKDFDSKVKGKGLFQQRVSEEGWEGILGSKGQRASWLIDDDWAGPYERELKDFMILIGPIWKDFVKKTQIDRHYNPDEYIVSMGVHRYNPDIKGEGLQAHCDDGILSILYSNEPLEGFIDGKWVTISIPEDSVMVMTGQETFLATKKPALFHRVPHCERKKFSITAFIGAPSKNKIVVHEDIVITPGVVTIDNFRETLFAGKFRWDFKK